MEKTVPEGEVPHMSDEEFRSLGYAMVDYIADYRSRLSQMSVQSAVAPGAVRAALPESPPLTPDSWEAIFADLKNIIEPGLSHWQSPSFFAYFPSNASYASVLGEMLSAGYGVQGMLWSTSPACTELESLVLDWFVEMLGLPSSFLSSGAGGGVIQDTASSAVLCALLAARQRAIADTPAALRLYCCEHAHSSVQKAARVAGLPDGAVRLVRADASGAADASHCAALVHEDVANGYVPFLIVATVGSTASMSIDPVPQLAEIARRHGMWLHVDAAMAGSAAVCPELRPLLNAGVEHADSWCFNPHKWLLTNFDCDCFYVADRTYLLRALSILPEYLRNAASESGAVIDYRDWHIPLGRRFRALKLWFVVRHYGVEGLRAFIRHHLALAEYLERRLAEIPSIRVALSRSLNLVGVAHVHGDDATRRLLKDLNDSGHFFLSHAVVNSTFVIRIVVGQMNVQQHHLDALVEAIRRLS